jgi:hypothetical protein
MALPTYQTGTVSVAAGGTVVTLTGGSWTGTNAKQGDFISIGGLAEVLITEVTDSTHLKIAPWQGTVKTNVAHVIYQNYVGRVVGVAAAEDVGDMLEKLHVDGLPFILGSAETVPDPSYGDEGQLAFKPSTGQWWVKTGGAWVPSAGISGVTEAPNNGTQYGRQSLAWTPITAPSFVQDGTGAVTRTMQNKVREIFSVMDFGATGDGTTDDTPFIQAAINAAIAAGGGTIYFPPASVNYKTVATLNIDVRGISTRLQQVIQLVGAGPGRSTIKNTTLAGAVIKYQGVNPGIENFFQMRDMRITGNQVVGSIGLQVTVSAYMSLRNVIIEVMGVGFDATDVEQASFQDCTFSYNLSGMIFNAPHPTTGITQPNSMTFLNTIVAGNVNFGVQMTNAGALNWVGGSIQYNGVQGGGAGNFGFAIVNSGAAGNYGTLLFSGMVFEGNRGVAQFASSQTDASSMSSVLFESVSFERTTVGYPTNDIAISGTAISRYKLSGCTFRSGAGYVASASRPCISNTNTSAATVMMDASTWFQNPLEAATAQQIVLGEPGVSFGVLVLKGQTSGAATILTPTVAGAPVLTTPTQTGTLVSTGHPASIKAWGKWNSAGTLGAAYGVSSVVRVGPGQWTVNLSPAMANTNYVVNITTGLGSTGYTMATGVHNITTTSFTVFSMYNNALTDPTQSDYICCNIIG